MTDRSEERNAGRQEMSDCLSAGMQYYCWSPMAGLIVCQWVAFGWHPDCRRTYIHAYSHTDRHTYMVQTYMQTVGPETSFKPGLGAMEIACNAMEIAAKQTLCEEASLEAGLEAMEIAIGCYGNCSKGETWLG